MYVTIRRTATQAAIIGTTALEISCRVTSRPFFDLDADCYEEVYAYRRSYLSDCKVYSCHNAECYHIVSQCFTYRKHDRNKDVHSGVCIDEASCDQEDDVYDQQEGKLVMCDASK